MKISSQFPLRLLSTICIVLCVATFLSAEKKEHFRRGSSAIQNVKFDPDARTVKLFDGMEKNLISTRVIPQNEFESKVYITNKTDKPLTVELPKAVVAVNVLKQYVDPQNGGFLGNNSGNQPQFGAAQSIGGQFQNNAFSNQGITSNQFGNFNNQNLFSGNNGGTGFFSIPPEKTVEIKLNTVCLDHGKKTPSPRKTYVLRKVEDHTSDPALISLLENYNPKTTDRMVMQAAAWHLSNDMSWKRLQAKRLYRIGGISRRYFSDRQLENAFSLVEIAENQTGSSPRRAKPIRDALPNSTKRILSSPRR